MFEKISISILPVLILFILTFGILKKIPIYEEFVEGAKDGFKVSISIIPYLVALIVCISMFRASGALEILTDFLSNFLEKIQVQADIIPIIFTRPLSGSATLGLFSEIANKYGGDAYITKLAAIMIGSSETTFYVLSVYFGSIAVKRFRYALLAGIIADITGIVLAILVARWFFLASIA